MVDAKHKMRITCNITQPHFNYPDEKHPLYCKLCKSDHLIDVINKKCVTCKLKQPSFNYPDEKTIILFFM